MLRQWEKAIGVKRAVYMGASALIGYRKELLQSLKEQFAKQAVIKAETDATPVGKP